jgi:probable rRNA maturation factor
MVARKGTPQVYFHFIDTSFFFPNRTRLKNFIVSLFRKEGVEVAAINYIFCNDQYLLQLNQGYLKHDTYTDIITFGLSKPNEPVIADIYISVERVKENAIIFQSSLLPELYRVVFHGALHLCGYKDKRKSDKQVMRSREDFYLNKYLVSRETKR